MVAKRAGDIMIPIDKYPHIPYWFTLRQAIAALEKSDIEVEGRHSLPRALLVFNEQYQLLGTVRRRDILRGLEPKFLRTIPAPSRRQFFEVSTDIDLLEISEGKIMKAIQEQADQLVSEVMQPIMVTLDANDPISKIVYKMVGGDHTLLPVLSDGKIVGVIRSVDIFHEIAKILL
ncbi:MAG: CBS domain-containing protein [Calditrichaeota bacterium]|nr:CBS domain-containing protein [Calditrichota bacterium]